MTDTSTNTTTTTTTDDVIERGILRDLPVKLTDAEQLERAKLAAKRREQLERTDSDLAAKAAKAKDEHRHTVAQMADEIRRLDDAVREGCEPRQVSCFKRYRAGLVEIVREDTREVIEFKAASQRERQIAIPGAGGVLEEAERQAADDLANAPDEVPAEDSDDAPDVGGGQVDPPDDEVEVDIPAAKTRSKRK